MKLYDVLDMGCSASMSERVQPPAVAGSLSVALDLMNRQTVLVRHRTLLSSI